MDYAQMVRSVGVFVIAIFGIHCMFAKPIYVSPDGSDQNAGLTKDKAMQTIGSAIGLAVAGDTILLLPGIYYGKTVIQNVNGSPEKPITLMSNSEDPDYYAVIDGQAQPTSDITKGAFDIISSSWLIFENIKFQNCWTDVVPITNSSYVSFIGCIFMGGRRVIYPKGKGCHHFLIENCFWNQGEEVWTSYDWEDMHHGSRSYCNGALFHPSGTSGSFVMRGNTIVNVFNAFRSKANSIDEDNNGEIYDNIIRNVADNDFEPEGWAWNLHYYHNKLHNIHKMYSIDDVKGGPLYIYGNVITESKDANAIDKVSGIWKYKEGPLSEPCHAFNNSYYTEAKVLKSGEGTNQLLKHFNNAYYFFQGSNRFQAVDCDSSYEFDYDCINQSWPVTITVKNQELNGIENYVGKMFMDAEQGDLRLEPGSSCIDAGKILSFPEFDWVQSFKGSAPDIGAFEGDELVEGPPFRYLESHGGSPYLENPRITRHEVHDSMLVLYFSAELDPATVNKDSVLIIARDQIISIRDISFPDNNFKMVISTDQPLPGDKDLSVRFELRPRGQNGEVMTHWASTVGYQRILYPESLLNITPKFPNNYKLDMLAYPNPFRGEIFVEVKNLRSKRIPLKVIDNAGRIVYTVLPFEMGDVVRYRFKAEELAPGLYTLVVIDNRQKKIAKVILTE